MPNVHFKPDGKSVAVRPGTSLLEAARRARVNIATRCGGNASCLMCKVRVIAGSTTDPNEKEHRKMGESFRQGVRLSCQTKVREEDVTVELPENPLKAAVRKLLEQQREEE